jgi:hypothetical protein
VNRAANLVGPDGQRVGGEGEAFVFRRAEAHQPVAA